jgi:cell division protein FtsB
VLKRWAARVGLALVLAMSLAYVPYRLLDPVGARRVTELERELRDGRARGERLRAENDELRREIAGLRDDPAAIEDAAREDLGMVRPDEIVLRIERRRSP